MNASTFSEAVKHFSIPSRETPEGIDVPIQGVFLVDLTKDPATTIPVNPVYNVVSKAYEDLRTPTVFKPATATAAGLTALWTPSTGKRFRLMGGTFSVGSDTTTAAGATIQISDAGTGIIIMTRLGTTSAGQGYSFTLPGNGYLSTAVDAVLNANLSAALTAGQAAFTVYGTEE